MNKRVAYLIDEATTYTDAMDIGGKNYIGLREEHLVKIVVKTCSNLLVNEANMNHDVGSDTYKTLMNESQWLLRYFGEE